MTRIPYVHHWLAAALIAATGWLALSFVWQDSLGNFADDGVSYMIMAQAWSPFADAPEVIEQGASYEKYPPLFPLILALTGAAQSYVLAHVLVALFFVASLVVLYFFALRLFASPWPALAAVALFAATPTTWLNLMGILSENLYILLTLAVLLWHRDRDVDRHTVQQTLILTLLLTACLLTRSVAVAMVMAVAVTTWLRQPGLKTFMNWRWYVPATVPLLAALMWSYLRPTSGSDLYAQDVSGVLASLLEQGFFATLATQISSLYQSLFTSFIVYWVSEWQPNFIVVALLVLAAAVYGGQRLMRYHADAWYLVFYLGILCVWPYPGQYNRFLYVIVPFVIVYALGGFLWLLRQLPPSPLIKVAPLIGLLVVLTALLPTSGFLAGRAGFETPYENMQYDNVRLFYNIPQLDQAKLVAHMHEQLRLDMQAIQQTTDKDATILWFAPNYIRLLAKRESGRIPYGRTVKDVLEGVKKTGADYIYLTRLHPRHTSLDFNGMKLAEYFDGIGDVAWSRHYGEENETVSMLLKIDKQRLRNKVAQLTGQRHVSQP